MRRLGKEREIERELKSDKRDQRSERERERRTGREHRNRPIKDRQTGKQTNSWTD